MLNLHLSVMLIFYLSIQQEGCETANPPSPFCMLFFSTGFTDWPWRPGMESRQDFDIGQRDRKSLHYNSLDYYYDCLDMTKSILAARHNKYVFFEFIIWNPQLSISPMYFSYYKSNLWLPNHSLKCWWVDRLRGWWHY